MKKKMLAVLLAGTMVVAALAGCGKEEATKTSESSKVEESKVEESKTEESTIEESKEEVVDYTGKTLRIGWWGGDARHESTMTIIEEFEKQYPGLTVEVEFAGFGDYFTRLNTQAAGGELPDVMQMSYAKIYNFAENDQLLDLTPYIADGSIDMTNVSENAVKMGEVCGGNYGVACGMNGLSLMYNPAILEEAGCTLSMEPSLSEFMEVGRTVYEKTGSRIHLLGAENGQIFYRSLGGDTWTDGEDVLGYTEEMLLEWLSANLKGVEEDILRVPNNMVEDNNASALATGEMWCILETCNAITSHETAAGIELEIVSQPHADNATVEYPTFLQPSMLWSVAADTELAEVAAAFIDYYTNNTYVYDVCGMDRGLPISSAIHEYLAPSLTEADKKAIAYLEYLGEHSTPMNIYAPAKSAEAAAVIFELYEKVTYAAVTQEELPALVHEAYEKANAILSSAE